MMGEDDFVRRTVEINLQSNFKIIDKIKKMDGNTQSRTEEVNYEGN
jgi:hypothetical protein